MLVLTRELLEKVIVRDSVGNLLGTITVVSIRGDSVKLGFEFPADHRVDRLEVDEKRQRALTE